ncbi:MAG: M15 family metallopeptidase [Minisyncoccia bacterium]
MMKPLTRKDYIILLAIGSFWVILLSVTHIFVYILYLYSENIVMEKEIVTNQTALTILKRDNIALKSNLNGTIENLKVAQETNSSFQNQIENISSVVGVLEKLSKTDNVLLKKYSKIFFLNENYSPQKLSPIDQKYILEKNRPMLIHSDVLKHLESMLENASSSGKRVVIASAYRSFAEQTSLKSQYKVTYGSGANKFSADQGYSEHQLGTTVDLTSPKLGNLLSQFEKSEEYKWLLENAYKYGFVLSYPIENKYYIFEPWHWRFVGVSLAERLHNDGTYFYALDQRDIDGYLINLFD